MRFSERTYLMIGLFSIIAAVILFKVGSSFAEITGQQTTILGYTFEAGGPLAGFLIIYLYSPGVIERFEKIEEKRDKKNDLIKDLERQLLVKDSQPHVDSKLIKETDPKLIEEVWSSYYGLQSIFFGKSTLHSAIDNLLNSLKANKNDPQINDRHRSFSILEIFLGENILGEHILEALENNVEIKMLFIDPRTEFAKNRAEDTKRGSPLNIIANDIKSIVDVVAKHLKKPEKENSARLNNNASEKEYIYNINENIKLLEILTNKIEIRFYNRPTIAPFYIIGNKILIGSLFYGISSIDNPWLQFIEDPHKTDDIYSKMLENFDKLWKTETTRSKLL